MSDVVPADDLPDSTSQSANVVPSEDLPEQTLTAQSSNVVPADDLPDPVPVPADDLPSQHDVPSDEAILKPLTTALDSIPGAATLNRLARSGASALGVPQDFTDKYIARPPEEIERKQEENPAAQLVGQGLGTVLEMEAIPAIGVAEGAGLAAKAGMAALNGFIKGATTQGASELDKYLLGQSTDPTDAAAHILASGALNAAGEGLFNSASNWGIKKLEALENSKLGDRVSKWLYGFGLESRPGLKDAMKGADGKFPDMPIFQGKDFEAGAKFFNNFLNPAMTGVAAYETYQGYKEDGLLGALKDIGEFYLLPKVTGAALSKATPMILKSIANGNLKRLATLMNESKLISKSAQMINGGVSNLFKAETNIGINGTSEEQKEKRRQKLDELISNGVLNQQIQNQQNQPASSPTPAFAKGGEVGRDSFHYSELACFADGGEVKKQMLLKKDLLERGFTEKMIKAHDITPDQVKKRSGGGSYHLYDPDRVSQLETTHNEEISKNRDALKQKEQVKQQKSDEKSRSSIADASNREINVPKMTLEQLKGRAIAAYNNADKRKADGFYAKKDSDTQFLNRIQVNYLRHHPETGYDDAWQSYGDSDAHDILQRRINDAIHNQYPHLRNEPRNTTAGELGSGGKSLASDSSHLHDDPLNLEASQAMNKISKNPINSPSLNTSSGLNQALSSPVINNSAMAEVYPELGSRLGMAKGNVSSYLTSLKPSSNNPKLAFDSEPDTREQSRNYKEALDVAIEPLSVLNHIKEGTLEPSHVQHLNSMYPDLKTHLDKKITEEIVKSQLNGTQPSSHTLQSMSLFLGTPLDSNLTPQNIQAAQGVFQSAKAAQAQQGQANKAKKGTAPLSKVSDSYLTGPQAREERQNKG